MSEMNVERIQQALREADRTQLAEYSKGAEKQREAFLQQFPRERWARLKLTDYALGHDKNDDNVCRWMEFKTKKLGSISGYSTKFSIFFHKKSGQWRYRDSDFSSEKEAWRALRADFIKGFDLADDGRFEELDNLPALTYAPMVRAKFLHIFYPDEILPIYSIQHIRYFLGIMGHSSASDESYNVVRLNRILLKALRELPESKGLSNVEIMRALYDNFSPRQAIDTKDAPYQLTPDQIEMLLSRFKSYMPDFNDFEAPGETLQKNELRYKWQMLKRYEREMGNDKVREMVGEGDVEEVVHFLRRISSGLVQYQNWRNTFGDKSKSAVAVLRAILDVASKPYQRTSDLKPIFDAAAKEGHRLDWDVLSTTLWLMRPEDFFPIKISYYMKLAEELGCALPKGRAGVNNFARVLEFGRTIREALQPLKPRDWVDVQSFIWVVCPRDEERARSVSQADEEEVEVPMHDNRTIPLNVILYGPPGTGKTWKLRNEYMPRFVEEAAAMSKEGFAAKLVETMSWWEVLTVVMLELKTAKVRDIQSHPLMQARIKRANNRNPKAAIWAHLQMHTKEDCETVKYTKRYEPLYFEKDTQSVWTIDEALAREEVPELVEKLAEYQNFTPGKGEKIERFAFTTFHQSYSYEDFVEGIKPKMADDEDMAGGGDDLAYEIKPGIFKTMVNRALADPDHDYALIIDEVNRGNVANIFGELITLIEDDKRRREDNELRATLPYSRDSFVVPRNLYIIGAMNTADRSVEALDTALRRRFTFECVPPEPALIEQPGGLEVDLAKLLSVINGRITKLLDKDHCIGHSYFMGIAKAPDPFAALQRIFATKVLPLLEEFFYGDPAKIGMVLGERFVSRNDESVEWAKGDWGIDDFEERRLYTLQDPLALSEEDFRSVYE